MKIYNDQTIEKIKLLRKKGYSINALVQEFSVPKTTVWHHIQNIRLSEKYLRDLRSNQGGSRKRKQLAISRAEDEAVQILSGPNSYHAGLLAMLYWAEGHQEHGFTFTNTNPNMMRLYTELLEKCLGIKKKQLSVTVRYYAGMDKNKCLLHWSEITGVPKKEIKLYYNDGQKKGRTKYGICRLTVIKGGYYHKIITALIANIVNKASPYRSMDRTKIS